MSPLQRVALALAVLFLVGTVGFTIGSRDDAPPATSAEVGFLHDMIAHHEQALVMSSVELSAGAEERVKIFAREVLQGQSYEIGLMEAYLQRWGYGRHRDDPSKAMGWMGHTMPTDEMPGMASEDDLTNLAAASGRDADARFLALMKEHHRGAVEMAESAEDAVADDALRDLARRMARNQAIEINELESTRIVLGLPDV